MLGWGGEVGVRVRTWGFRLATLFPSRLQWAPPPGVWPIQRNGRLTRPALHTHVLASSFRLTFPVNDIFGLPPALRRTACSTAAIACASQRTRHVILYIRTQKLVDTVRIIMLCAATSVVLDVLLVD